MFTDPKALLDHVRFQLPLLFMFFTKKIASTINQTHYQTKIDISFPPETFLSLSFERKTNFKHIFRVGVNNQFHFKLYYQFIFDYTFLSQTLVEKGVNKL